MDGLKGGRYHLETFGCQMNKYDSEKIQGVLAGRGMVPASGPGDADLILLNTCSIREKAEQKVFSRIGRLAGYKKKNRNLLIALGGCMATLRGKEIFRRAPGVDILFGPDSLSRLPELIDGFQATRVKGMDVEFAGADVWDSPEHAVRPSSVSAWVGIMKGCDNRCSYCVVPYTRGPEVSRPAQSIIAEVEELARNGCREVNLLGQNVNSYGKGLPGGIGFPELLMMVNDVDGIERVRFMTSHPKDLTDELIEAMSSAEKVCPSLHLPVQAGSDRILEMMGRGYTAREYLEKVAKLKTAIPGITLSTDIMVGFPTETEEDFRDTLTVMKEARFDSMYLFIYSPRPGTPAEELEGRVPRDVAGERFDRAQELHYATVAQNNSALIGDVVEVLCEGPYNEAAKRDNSQTETYVGRTPGNHQVIFSSLEDVSGRNAPVEITGTAGYNLKGTMARERL